MNEMESRGSASEGPSTHIDGNSRLSPSLPPQLWTTFSPPSPRNYSEPIVDETTLAQRAAAFRQLHGNPRTPPRKHRQAKSIGNRSSLSSQPVLVRSYTPDASPPGSGPSSSASNPPMARNGVPPPPSEFTMDGILKAIEPDIRDCLDEIAKICGRSRLSLANEYGSHMPPQGEIRDSNSLPFDHMLLPVEEASSSNERLAGDMPAIAGDDYSFDERIDMDAHPAYGLLESFRASQRYHVTASSSWGDGSSMQVDHDIHRPTSVDDSVLPMPPHPIIEPPLLRDRGHRSKSANWLVHGERKTARLRPGEVFTAQPVVSEVRLDAQGGHGRSSFSQSHTWMEPDINYGAVYSHEHPDLSSMPYVIPSSNTSYNTSTLRQRLQNLSILKEAQSWLSWLNVAGPALSAAEQQSAETNLRAILERHAIVNSPVGIILEDEHEYSFQ